MKYKHILFDWDGCLANTLPAWLKAYRDTFTKFDLQPSDQEIIDIFGNWEGPQLLGVNSLERFNQLLPQEIYRIFAGLPLHEGIRQQLQLLADAGGTMAVVSSSLRHFVQDAIAFHGLESYFAEVVAGDDVTKHKPHPEPLLKAMDELGAQKETTIMIGDNEVDIQAGQAAGVDTCLFYPDAHRRFYPVDTMRTLNATYEIAAWDRLMEVIGG